MPVTLSVEPTSSQPALTLRPWQDADATSLVLAHHDPLLRRWLTTHLDTGAEARQWIEEQGEGWATGDRLSFAVVERAAEQGDMGRPVGHVCVRKGSGPAEGSAEVGYWTSAGARSKGIASRALEAVSCWALGPQRLIRVDRLALLHSVGNHASCRVVEKTGYALRSLLPAHPPAFPNEGHLHVRRNAGT
jgi:RimJ/RimL family protein N-acetyltransferase